MKIQKSESYYVEEMQTNIISALCWYVNVDDLKGSSISPYGRIICLILYS